MCYWLYDNMGNIFLDKIERKAVTNESFYNYMYNIRHHSNNLSQPVNHIIILKIHKLLR